MKRLTFSTMFILAGLSLTRCGGGAGQDAHENGSDTVAVRGSKEGPVLDVTKADELRMAMRRVWEDHITWTRLYIVSVAANLPDKDATAGRLMKNQEDIGAAIKPYYGAEAGDKLTALLKEHIQGAAAILDAAKKKDSAKLEEAKKAWSVNGEQIAAFLNGANPENWKLDAMKKAMQEHLNTTLDEAVARLGGDYAKDVAGYDTVKDHIYMMADVLSYGIIAQFPEKF